MCINHTSQKNGPVVPQQCQEQAQGLLTLSLLLLPTGQLMFTLGVHTTSQYSKDWQNVENKEDLGYKTFKNSDSF